MSGIWVRIDRLLKQRLAVQRLLNFRFPKLVSRNQQLVLLNIVEQQLEVNCMIGHYAGFSSPELMRLKEIIESELDFELEKLYYEY